MQIVTAYPEYAGGSGWRNEPLWIVVRGWIDGRTFTAEVRCFDGDAATLSMLWTNEARLRVHSEDRERALTGD